MVRRSIKTALLRPINTVLDRIQSILALEFLERYPQFANDNDDTANVKIKAGQPPPPPPPPRPPRRRRRRRRQKNEANDRQHDGNVDADVDEDDDNEFRPGLGRIGLLACILGVQWGIHACLLCGIPLVATLSSSSTTSSSNVVVVVVRGMMIWTWCFYIVAMCTFHLLEFFVTCVYNPTVVTSDSFLINHSKPYTAAAILATLEFWIRFTLFVPSQPPHGSLTLLGVVMVMVSQLVRSWAMKTCGESFNHFIQTERKDNHTLVTTGIYKVLRHPSYVGFFYWSIGTQLVMRNWICMVVFALAGWSFFSKRIPYEERSLLRLFGNDYYEYALRTYVGIPGIPSAVIRDSLPPPPQPQEEEEEGHEVGVDDLHTTTTTSSPGGGNSGGDKKIK